jgi:hypothetical protein
MFTAVTAVTSKTTIHIMQACMMLEYIHEEIRVDAIVEEHAKKNKELKKKGQPEIVLKLDPPKRPEFLTQAESDRQARLRKYLSVGSDSAVY